MHGETMSDREPGAIARLSPYAARAGNQMIWLGIVAAIAISATEPGWTRFGIAAGSLVAAVAIGAIREVR